MATVKQPILSEETFHNWIKQGLALVITKEGLQNIVTNEISQFRQRIYDDIYKRKGIATGTICNSCNTEKIVKCSSKYKICKGKCAYSNNPCPLKICDDVRNEIIKAHRFAGPSWKNTDARRWASSDWEIAKCFMPSEGYRPVSGAAETDFNGVISVILNCLEFKSRIKEDLSDKSNLFCEAREVGRTYRHCASFEVSNKDLKDGLLVLSNVLTDPTSIAADKTAKAAAQELQELSKASWAITDKNMLRHLQLAINEAKESFDQRKEKILEEVKAYIQGNKREEIANVLAQLHHILSKYKAEIEKEVQHGMKRIRKESVKDTAHKRQKKEELADYEKLKADLQQRLIQTYRSRCLSLPVSPLLEEEELPLLTFYVQPNMRCLHHHRVQKEKKHVDSYRDIFFKGEDPCKNIYITGDAGIGKTVMCQRMVLLWCLVHQTRLETEDESILVDSESMEEFDFLFYISLRDTTFCHIEDVVQHQILGLTNSKTFLLKILRTEKCLIILDGLDEWTHQPEIEHCPSNTKVPHREGLENCVFLTTSRPYKLERLRLGTHEIDQQIEILGMEEGVGFEYVELLVNLLNEKCDQTKDPEEFIEEVAENKLDDLLDVPLITTHLICLWFDEKLTKMSVSEVYANTLEMMFERASKRRSRSEPVKFDAAGQTTLDLKPPESISRLEHVQKHILTMYNLSYLAFDTLFTDKDPSLVFSDSDLDRYGISDDTITYLCSVGILSKSKAIGFLTERRHTLSFPHKLYQEFMAALYISMSGNNESYIRDSIVAACKSLADVKKFSDVFIFLASLAPVVVETLFQRVNAVVSNDQTVSDFRDFSCCAMFHFISQRRQQVENMVKSIQELAVKCFDEAKRSGGKNIDFKLEDIFIYKSNVPQIKAMLQSSKTSVKSIFMSGSYLGEELSSVTGLVRLEIRYIDSSTDFKRYAKLMSASSTTLKNISICYCPKISDMPVESLNQLTSLYIHNVNIKHDYLLKLIDFVSKKHDISQIGLDAVQCEYHAYDCTLGDFDLRGHEMLYLLGIGSVNFEHVHINVAGLIRLNLDYKRTIEAASWTKPLLKDLMFAQALKKVVIRNISDRGTVKALVRMLASIQSLRYIFLLNIDFYESILELDQEGADVDIEMSHVTLTRKSFCRFLESIENGRNSASVNMLFYNIIPAVVDVKNFFHAKPRLQVSRKTDVSLKFITKIK